MPTIIVGRRKIYLGPSTETKPTTGVDVGDQWIETDTGKVLVWDGATWKDATAAAAAVPWAIGLAGFYVDDLLIADRGITGRLKVADFPREVHVFLGQSPSGLDAATTGVKHETANVLLSPELLQGATAAYFEAGLLQRTGGTIALELYDATAAAVVTSLSLTATTYRTRSADILPSLVAGNEYRARLNVTAAGASGSVAGNAFYRLVIVR